MLTEMRLAALKSENCPWRRIGHQAHRVLCVPPASCATSSRPACGLWPVCRESAAGACWVCARGRAMQIPRHWCFAWPTGHNAAPPLTEETEYRSHVVAAATQYSGSRRIVAVSAGPLSCDARNPAMSATLDYPDLLVIKITLDYA